MAGEICRGGDDGLNKEGGILPFVHLSTSRFEKKGKYRKGGERFNGERKINPEKEGGCSSLPKKSFVADKKMTCSTN